MSVGEIGCQRYMHSALWGRYASTIETTLQQDYDAVVLPQRREPFRDRRCGEESADRGDGPDFGNHAPKLTCATGLRAGSSDRLRAWGCERRVCIRPGRAHHASEVRRSDQGQIRQAETDTGQAEGVSTESARVILEQKRKIAELEQTIEILKAATSFFVRERSLRWRGLKGIRRSVCRQGSAAALRCRNSSGSRPRSMPCGTTVWPGSSSSRTPSR